MKKLKVLFISLLSFTGVTFANKIIDSSYILDFHNIAIKSHEVNLGDKVCRCGGKLNWTAKCYTEKMHCSSCNGKGYIESGNYKTKCNMCDGKGYYIVWKSGYVCTSCGKRYSD